MNSFELNKFIGAILGVVFVVFSISLLSDAVFSSPEPETPGYAIAVPESAPEGGGEAPAAESVLPLLASADVSAGEAVFKRCGACHTIEQGGPNKVGPNLWGVVDRPIAGHEGFSYSSALTEFSEGGQKHWTYENLDHFLTSPKGLVPGTAMSFAGLGSVQDRANLIAYLRTMADQPAALPEAAPAAQEGAAAPAEGGGEQAAQAAADPVLSLLANADASNGEAIFKRCGACHTAEQGGPNKAGPNLWGVVDRPIASHEGFSYSGALKEFSEGGQKTWTYQNLDHFLESPKGLVPGTAMSFAGLSKDEDRADLIAYLRTLADQPAPLPGAATPAAGEGGAPAEGGAAAPAEGAAPAAPAEGAPAGGTQAPAQPEGNAAPAAPEGGATQPAPAQ